jgi:hypothetical protein
MLKIWGRKSERTPGGNASNEEREQGERDSIASIPCDRRQLQRQGDKYRCRLVADNHLDFNGS